MTLAKSLSLKTLTRIQDAFNLEEVEGAKGGVYLPLPSKIPGVPPGICRVFRGDKIPLMVYVAFAFPPAGLDSHMLFAFTDQNSLVPHFTVDSVKVQDYFAFHLDLIPKIDLGSNINYLNEAFQPLTGIFDEASRIEGLIKADLSPRQKALMSPWMLAYRANESAFRKIEGAVERYFQHWSSLLKAGFSDQVVASIDGRSIATRDIKNRAAIFSPEIDPVWNKITPMIGESACTQIQYLLKGVTAI